MSDVRTSDPVAGAALYQDLVVERARHPLHGGAVEPPDGAGDGTNPLCGDKVHVTLRLGPDRTAAEIRHRTRGCAICAASADLMAEHAQGHAQPEAEALFRQFEQLLVDGEASLDAPARDRLGPLLAFAELHDYRSRRKCATLPWSALLAAYQPAGTPGEAP